MIQIAEDIIFGVAAPYGGGGGAGSEKQERGGGMFTTELSLADFCAEVADELNGLEGFTQTESEGDAEKCESKCVMAQDGADWLVIVEIEVTDQDEVFEVSLRNIAP